MKINNIDFKIKEDGKFKSPQLIKEHGEFGYPVLLTCFNLEDGNNFEVPLSYKEIALILQKHIFLEKRARQRE